MKAHIVGAGFGGLVAAAYLIRNAGVSGQDITIYEADERMGGGLFLGGSAETGYNMPASVFDKEFRCTFDLLQTISSASGSAISVKDEFFKFNTQHPFHDRVHIIDGNGRAVPHAPRFGLSVRDGLDLVRLGLTPEALLDGRRIEEFFSPRFFSTGFWLLWSTIFGSLPQHSVTEFRRYMNRALGLFPDLSDLRHVLRTPVNQYQAFIEPLVAWLRPRGVNFLASAFVRDIGFAPSDGGITVNRVDYERDGAATSVAVASDDIVLITTGSQVEDLSVGSMTEAPRPRQSGRSSKEISSELEQVCSAGPLAVHRLYADRHRQLRRHWLGKPSLLGCLLAVASALPVSIDRLVHVRVAVCRQVDFSSLRRPLVSWGAQACKGAAACKTRQGGPSQGLSASSWFGLPSRARSSAGPRSVQCGGETALLARERWRFWIWEGRKWRLEP